MFAGYFDTLLCPVCPVPAPPHARSKFPVSAVTVPARGIMRATVPFNLTDRRFGVSQANAIAVRGRSSVPR